MTWTSENKYSKPNVEVPTGHTVFKIWRDFDRRELLVEFRLALTRGRGRTLVDQCRAFESHRGFSFQETNNFLDLTIQRRGTEIITGRNVITQVMNG